MTHMKGEHAVEHGWIHFSWLHSLQIADKCIHFATIVLWISDWRMSIVERRDTRDVRVPQWERGTKEKNIHWARQRYSKSEKPVMLLMHWDSHAHRAAQGSGVKEGFHLFYLSPLFRLHRAHPFSPLFSLLQWGTDLNRADRNLPEWNAFLQ